MNRSNIVVALALLLGGCGSGVGDEELAKAGSYDLWDSGGDQKMIILKRGWLRDRIVVSPRVDDYEVYGRTIIVARRPTRSIWNDNSIVRVDVLPICEYWLIDANAETAVRVNNDGRWPDVACK